MWESECVLCVNARQSKIYAFILCVRYSVIILTFLKSWRFPSFPTIIIISLIYYMLIINTYMLKATHQATLPLHQPLNLLFYPYLPFPINSLANMWDYLGEKKLPIVLALRTSMSFSPIFWLFVALHYPHSYFMYFGKILSFVVFLKLYKGSCVCVGYQEHVPKWMYVCTLRRLLIQILIVFTP